MYEVRRSLLNIRDCYSRCLSITDPHSQTHQTTHTHSLSLPHTQKTKEEVKTQCERPEVTLQRYHIKQCSLFPQDQNFFFLKKQTVLRKGVKEERKGTRRTKKKDLLEKCEPLQEYRERDDK